MPRSQTPERIFDERVYTMQEAANLLGISYSEMQRKVKSGVIRSCRLGKGPKAHVRIPDRSLQAYLAEGMVPAAKP